MWAKYISARGGKIWQWRRIVLLTISTAFLLLGIQTHIGAQRTVPVRVDRFLSLRSMTGTVALQSRSNSRAARVGDRLQAIGDGLTTSRESTARLEVDTGIGFVDVSENTQMRIRRMDVAPDNGRITHIEVPQGQVRLRLRPFTHEGSELEIHTPAGVSGVRGTEFGVGVQPDGKMGVATLTGAVATSAQSQTVEVPGGFQNLTVPGQPPSPATPLRDDPNLDFEVERIIEGGLRRLRFIGKVDPVNLVLVEAEPQATDINGEFVLDLLPAIGARVQITVITPLGNRRDYDLALL